MVSIKSLNSIEPVLYILESINLIVLESWIPSLGNKLEPRQKAKADLSR
jgi:hypothetical protein